LIGVDITDGTNEIMLFTDAGKVVRFKEAEESEVLDENGNPVLDENGNPEIRFKGVRPMGRTATGVRGIKMADDQRVVSLIVPKSDGAILTVTENGYGKRTALEDYPSKSRATQGVVSIKVSERNGAVVGAVQVDDNDEIMIISNRGTLVRTRVNEVSTVGRNTQGVILIRTIDEEQVVGLQRIEEIEVDELEAIEGEAVEVVDTNTEETGDNPPSE
ncbi:MAG: DNA gyrase C-terminal beta-propeller domain-containing protein, partial [Pseudomonadota bacterium]